MEINDQGHLVIGGVDAVQLAKDYGTPLFVYDVEHIRRNARSFVQTFQQLGVKAQVAYASKAFSSIAILQIIKEEGLSLDVVSQGELHTALQAEFPAERIHLHGNNKSKAELEMAIMEQIGCIVVDNFWEIELLKELLNKHNREMDVLIRVTPGIEAHTHDYILTGQEDSKFGFDLWNGQAEQALHKLMDSERIHVKGLHCHIGSQIFETTGFVMAVRKLFEALADWKKRHGFAAEIVNLGGGFGIQYTDDDQPLPLALYVEQLVQEVKEQMAYYSLPLPEIWIEPGRAIVGDAGATLYTVGAIKEIPGVRTYVSVDGGMTDNLRPALYQAKYQADVVNKMYDTKNQTVSIAGKCCESGDMLIWDVDVPSLQSGDIIITYSTGAYGYSMSNHYNRFPKAAVVFVENGHHQLVVKREMYQDLTRLDLPYERP
ncbi:diaminopimelate decarboxylase [Pontibacillus litoralis]|uniref:Diaminopimelate decarboxylase n=1 Tax=Pontibacillus litoralis JSM 072002 TaxID=1385512 RepID=A0A0A5G4F4_9BACI|nr:diaminopimelate decarboxylase [Pontibacillus litoralis]KGX85970.1 diaminopimelate decarboxylase [Pontibacillus litoralis JSM 072002]